MNSLVQSILPTAKDRLPDSVSDLLQSAHMVSGPGARIHTKDKRYAYWIAAENADDHHLVTESGAKLYAQDDDVGRFAAEQFDVRPATAHPTPQDNATQFQRWVDAHRPCSTVVLPNWDIPLGRGINFGARNVEGQGDATTLIFSDLAGDEDCLTLSGGRTDIINHRAGKIRNLVLKCQHTGRDAIRWTGGIGIGAFAVTIDDAARDAIHFEQAANFQYMERCWLDQVTVSGAGRYGLCLRLAPFGPNDVQFVNKCEFANSKLFQCHTGDVAFLLDDDETTGSGSKIGGGVLFRNFHAQYTGNAATRGDGAILIRRGPDSYSTVDWLEFINSTFESSGTGAGAPVRDRCLMIEDYTTVANARAPLLEFFDHGTLLTGYGRWWDYNAPSPIGGLYRVTTPLQGTYTNDPGREFGTRSDKSGTKSVSAGGETHLFDAGRPGAAWTVFARSAFNPGSFVHGTVYGDATSPRMVTAHQVGNLRLVLSGTNVAVANAGGHGMSIVWSVKRAIL